jgi:hypothetical protein
MLRNLNSSANERNDKKRRRSMKPVRRGIMIEDLL